MKTKITKDAVWFGVAMVALVVACCLLETDLAILFNIHVDGMDYLSYLKGVYAHWWNIALTGAGLILFGVSSAISIYPVFMANNKR